MRKEKDEIEIEVLGDNWNQLFCGDECEKLDDNGNCGLTESALSSTDDGYPALIRSDFCLKFFRDEEKVTIWRQGVANFWENQEKEADDE
jgi:hypothetical protein